MAEVDSCWGRKTQATWWTVFGSLLLVVMSPLWVTFNWITLEYYNGSVHETANAIATDGLPLFLNRRVPRPSVKASGGYILWLLAQGVLYSLLPGPRSTGQMTPAGNLLKYKTNGLLAWVVTHALVVMAGVFGVLDLALLTKHWMGLLVAANVYGLLLALFCQIKAHVAPSFPNDRKISGKQIPCMCPQGWGLHAAGSLIFDYFAGIELNPRFGQAWDFKLFHNGRPGIIAWTLM